MKTENKPFRKTFISGFKYAFNGIKSVIATERNIKILLAAATAVIIAGFIFGITRMEWCIVIICIGTVIVAEMTNSALENICDKITTDYDEKIGKIKDISAGITLVTVLFSIVIGLIIFVPYVIKSIS